MIDSVKPLQARFMINSFIHNNLWIVYIFISSINIDLNMC